MSQMVKTRSLSGEEGSPAGSPGAPGEHGGRPVDLFPESSCCNPIRIAPDLQGCMSRNIAVDLQACKGVVPIAPGWQGCKPRGMMWSNRPTKKETFDNSILTTGAERRRKSLFKSKKNRTPAELVRATRDLLMSIDFLAGGHPEKEEKLAELNRNLLEMKFILYGNPTKKVAPVPGECEQLTQEIFKDNVLRLMIQSVPKIDLEARKDTRHVVANLQRQLVQSRLIASDYLEKNLDLLDLLLSGYENPKVAVIYGTMLRECIHHKPVARYLLDSGSWKRLLQYMELPNFDVASDAAATFRELMTAHKPVVAEFLMKNYHSFFAEYNSTLLDSPNYITRRQAAELLGDILGDRIYTAVMLKYISSKQNLIRVMKLLAEPRKNMQLRAFQVFKLFVANPNKPKEIVTILLANREKLLQFFDDFLIDEEDELFEEDKAWVVQEIEMLGSQDDLLKNEWSEPETEVSVSIRNTYR